MTLGRAEVGGESEFLAIELPSSGRIHAASVPPWLPEATTDLACSATDSGTIQQRNAASHRPPSALSFWRTGYVFPSMRTNRSGLGLPGFAVGLANAPAGASVTIAAGIAVREAGETASHHDCGFAAVTGDVR